MQDYLVIHDKISPTSEVILNDIIDTEKFFRRMKFEFDSD